VRRAADVRDLQTLLARDLEVDVDIEARINDDRLAAVSDHIRRTAKIPIQHLTKEHGEPSWLFLTLLVDKVTLMPEGCKYKPAILQRALCRSIGDALGGGDERV
jgi:hypothetical protein